MISNMVSEALWCLCSDCGGPIKDFFVLFSPLLPLSTHVYGSHLTIVLSWIIQTALKGILGMDDYANMT